MRVHEAVAKEAGAVLRCSLEGCDAGRWLELPAWMLDRVSCAPMRIEERPCEDGRQRRKRTDVDAWAFFDICQDRLMTFVTENSLTFRFSNSVPIERPAAILGDGQGLRKQVRRRSRRIR